MSNQNPAFGDLPVVKPACDRSAHVSRFSTKHSQERHVFNACNLIVISVPSVFIAVLYDLGFDDEMGAVFLFFFPQTK